MVYSIHASFRHRTGRLVGALGRGSGGTEAVGGLHRCSWRTVLHRSNRCEGRGKQSTLGIPIRRGRLGRGSVLHFHLVLDGRLHPAPPPEHRLFRIILPRLSATCTESLTPFLSLLPCSGRAGLGSLLNPHRLFDGEWTLLGVHFTRQERLGRVKLEVGSVADPVRVDRLAGGLGSRGSPSSSSILDARTLIAYCQISLSNLFTLARSSELALSPRRPPSPSPSRDTRLLLSRWSRVRATPNRLGGTVKTMSSPGT